MGLGDSCGGFDLLLRCMRSAVDQVLPHGAVEEEDVLAHEADGTAQVGGAQVPQVEAVEADGPGGDVVEAEDQLEQGGLARSRGPHDGGGLARLDAQVEGAEHPRTGGVGELDGVESHRATDLLAGQGGRPVGDAGLGVEHVEHPVGRRHRPLVEVGGLAESGEGPEESLGEEHHHAVGPHLEHTVEGEETAVHEGGGEAHEHHDADQGREGGAETDRPSVGLAVGVALGGDPAHLALFGHEALDGGDPPEVVRELGVERGHPLPDLGVARFHAPLEAKRAPKDHRNGHERHPGHGGSEVEEGGAHQHHRGGHLQQLVGAAVEKPLELVDVVVENRHQAAGAAVFEVGQLELLDPGVGVEPELVLHRLGEVAPEHRVSVFEGRFQGPDEKGQGRQHHDLLAGIDDSQVGEERGLATHDDVDRHADEHGRGEVEKLVEHRARGGEQRLSAMPGRIAPETAQGMDSRRVVHARTLPPGVRARPVSWGSMHPRFREIDHRENV